MSRIAPIPTQISLHSSDPPNPWAGYLQVMERAVSSSATHMIVLQDDVIPCRKFAGYVVKAIQERPEDVVSLWVGGLRNQTRTLYLRAMIAKQHWVPVFFRDIHHCVALVWPRQHAEAFLEWTRTSMLPGDGRDQQSDDAIVGAWARRTHNLFWAHVPSLVEHNDEIESTIGRARGDAGRRAISFQE